MKHALSPMQRHTLKIQDQVQRAQAQAALEAGAVKPLQADVEDYHQFEVLKASLEQDVKVLESKPREARNAVRKTLVQRYQAHVEAYLASGQEYANPVLVAMLMWLIDLREWASAFRLGKVAVEQKQQLPNHFNRNLPTLMADELLDWARKEYQLGRSTEPYFTEMRGLIASWPVPDVVRMKYQKLSGEIAFDRADWAEAIQFFERAIELETPNHKANVSTKLGKARNGLHSNDA